MTKIQELTCTLGEKTFEGYSFNCLPIKGEHEVLQVLVSEWEDMPIYVTVTDTQILCISYLCRKDEIQPDKMADLNELLLELNVSVPLSSFSLVDDYYVIFGALATTSSDADICKELVTLAPNAYDALEAIETYLN
ncbi:MAG: YjfI family protein [Pseudomonadales bacterium]|nr:YjfI family protein [Pseudomonadales bacterium]